MSIPTYLGFGKEEAIDNKYQDSFPNTDTLDLKLAYLKQLESHEATRMSAIETKTSQLIGMTSIIFSLLGLFISNYVTKFQNLQIGVQIILIAVFLIGLSFYINTIFQASRYLDISKHAYGQRSTTTVQQAFGSESQFKIEEIKDLLFSIERSILVNNRKSNYLIYGYRSFKIATTCVGLLSVLLLTAGYFSMDPKPNRVVVENSISGKNLESIMNNAVSHLPIPKVILVHDTIYKK